MRGDEKPSRIESSSPEKFRFRANRSYLRYVVATVYQHGRNAMANPETVFANEKR